jgi:hypothetical protein
LSVSLNTSKDFEVSICSLKRKSTKTTGQGQENYRGDVGSIGE